MTSRRDFLKLAALFSTAGSLPLLQACGRRADRQPDAPLTIGYLPITDATPLLVAHARGLFAEQGVQVEKPVLFRSWASLVEAFLSGQVNLIHLLSPMSIWARYGSGSPIKVVMWNHMAGSALTVAPDIRRIADLSGRTVAIPFWYSIHNVVLQALLRAEGLKVVERTPQAGEVRLAVMAPADMVAALAAGTVAGFIVAEPFNAAAETKGVGRVLRFSGDVWRDHACCVTLMQERDIQTRPQWVQGVVNALVDAQVFAAEHRRETAALLAKSGPHRYTPHEAAVLEQVLAPSDAAWARYHEEGIIRHPEWTQKRIDFQPYPFPSYTEALVAMLKQTHIAGVNRFLDTLDPTFAARDLVDDRFVRTAVEHGGHRERFGLSSWTRQEIIAV
ncbi:MAG: ABC transporter substrate-binding protein [Eikenella sp.]|nr:ABC transporter substrate-binding protein [Eikenella sp.]